MTTTIRPVLLLLALALPLASCGPHAAGDAEPRDIVEPVPPAPPLLVTHAVAHHTCALDEAGVVTCWGRNDRGQLGVGHTRPIRLPVQVAPGRRFEMVSVGGHTCALDGEGVVHCWGPNEHGQLGDGGHADRTSPVPTASERRFARIAVGGAHTCALDDVGRAFCWGDNRWGQLGDGTRETSDIPVAVTTDAAFSRLSAGSRHTCGITGDETVLCWGDNFLGQLAQPRGFQGSLAPVLVTQPTGVVRISAGHGHTCAIDRGGAGWCWGQNGIGQLGTGAPPGTAGPMPLADLPPLAELRTGYHHTCAVAVDGRGWCWGANTSAEPGNASISGQLGNDVSWSNLPLPLALDAALDDIAPGDGHTCVLSRARVIQCFGSNRFGQLGRARPARSIEPVGVFRLGEAPVQTLDTGLVRRDEPLPFPQP